jgi:hypothetical protein
MPQTTYDQLAIVKMLSAWPFAGYMRAADVLSEVYFAPPGTPIHAFGLAM